MGRCAGPAARGTHPRGLTRARAEAPELREALPLPLLRGGKPKSRRIPAAHRDRAVKSIKGMLRTLADVDDEVVEHMYRSDPGRDVTGAITGGFEFSVPEQGVCD